MCDPVSFMLSAAFLLLVLGGIGYLMLRYLNGGKIYQPTDDLDSSNPPKGGSGMT